MDAMWMLLCLVSLSDGLRLSVRFGVWAMSFPSNNTNASIKFTIIWWTSCWNSRREKERENGKGRNKESDLLGIKENNAVTVKVKKIRKESSWILFFASVSETTFYVLLPQLLLHLHALTHYPVAATLSFFEELLYAAAVILLYCITSQGKNGIVLYLIYHLAISIFKCALYWGALTMAISSTSAMVCSTRQ